MHIFDRKNLHVCIFSGVCERKTVLILVYYLILINVAAFTLYGLDKSFAVKHKWRISEAMLILVACLGGAPGAGLGMLVFHHKTKKKKFRVTIPILIGVFILLNGFFLYQNYRLVVTEYEFRSPKVSASMDGYVIVQISDLHNQWFGFGEGILLDKIRECEPDMIVVTGDVLDSGHTRYSFAEDFFQGAVEIAPVYYISGNHEQWLKGERLDQFLEDIRKMGVHLLDDRAESVDGFRLAGVAEESLGRDLTELLHPEGDSGELAVLLAHEPKYHESYKNSGADLVLTGHVHGGQIIVPGKGGLMSPDFEFFPELYEGEHTFGEMTMIISRGLGNSAFPVRINNYPEIVKVVLRSR